MRTVLTKFALLAAFAAAPLAKADTYHFSFTLTKSPAVGGFSFDLDSSPSILYVDPHGYYSETEVIPIEAGGKTLWSTTRWSSTQLEFSSDDYELFGGTPLTGDLASPTFLTGTFPMDEVYNNERRAGLLVVSSVTPEPASLWLLATGTIGVVAANYRRRMA